MPGTATIAWLSSGTFPIKQVQTKTYGSVNSSTQNHTITLSTQPVNGNVLIMTVVSDTTVSNPPTGWLFVTSAVDFTGTYMLWRRAKQNEPTSITLHLDSADTVTIGVLEYSGITTLDKFNDGINQGTGTAINTGTTPTTTAANELIVTLAGGMTPANVFISWDNSVVSTLDFISTGGGGAEQHQTVGTRIVSSTGAFTANATYTSNGSGHCSGIIGTFK